MLNLLLVSICLVSGGCASLMHKTAISATGGLLAKASEEVWQEGNIKFFEQGVPGNLKMMEGLLHVSPEDRGLLASLTKGYAGFAYVVNETETIKDKILGLDESYNIEQAIFNYSKAASFGNRYLKTMGVDLDKVAKDLSNQELLSRELSKIDEEKEAYETVFFLAQSMGSLILLQQHKIYMLAKRPMVDSLIKWVCQRMPNINNGACQLFDAMNLTLTPPMMGGDPEKGRQIFVDNIQKRPNNWIFRTAYIRFYLAPQGDEEGYAEQKSFLEAAREKFVQSLHFDLEKQSKPNKLKLFQALALKRFEIIKSLEEEIF